MRLGVVAADPRSFGGSAQYSAAAIDALSSGGLPAGIEQMILLRSEVHTGRGGDGQWHTCALFPPGNPRRYLPGLRRLLGERSVAWFGRALKRSVATGLDFAVHERAEIGRWYRKNGVDLIFWGTPNPLAFECGLPFVMPVHDLQHRLQPSFPEVSESGQLEAREYLFRNAAQRATMIFVDSTDGRDDILEMYPGLIPSERIVVLPFVAPPHLALGDPDEQIREVRFRYKLPERYFFYPAQFWPHKNHDCIVRALAVLSARGRSDICVVFCGAHDGPEFKRTYRTTMRLSSALSVDSQVMVMPYVPDSLMAGLYLGSAGLVMPTFFGPTNIPILEAWKLGRPVITSDIRGVRNQAGDGAVLVDPTSPGDLADAMQSLWDDQSLASQLVAAGHLRDAEWTTTDFARRLRVTLSAAARLAITDGGQRGRAR